MNLITLIILAIIAYLAYFFFLKLKLKQSAFIKTESNIIPTFYEIDSGFIHKPQDPKITHDVMDVISFRPTSDGLPFVLVTGAAGQNNALLTLKEGRSVDVVQEYGLEGIKEETAYGLLAVDIDGDGDKEILIAQDSGIYVYSRNPGETKYQRSKLNVSIPDRQIPISITASDTRKCGYMDLYVSTYIKHEFNKTAIYNDPDIRDHNLFLQNNGDGTFENRTEEAGLSFSQNTFMSKFVDLTGDGFEDLVIAPNTDTPRLFANNGNGTFTEKNIPGGYGFWMGIGIDDKTKSGLPDLYFTNVGNSVPAFLLKGDLREGQKIDLKFAHLKNQGSYQFEEVSKQLNTNTNVFGWGVEWADFTNNGRNDLVITENYTAFPFNLHSYIPTPGKFLVQGKDGKYVRVDKVAGVSNRHFGYRALAVDMNNNGYKDLIIGNIGGPLRIFMNNLS